MTVDLSTLQKINWFLQPVAKFILFLFTTKKGIFLLFVAFLFFIILRIALRIKHFKLLNKSAFGSYGITFGSFLGIVSEELSVIFSKIIANFTILLASLFILFGTVGIASALKVVDDYISNQKRIQQLKVVLKNLNQRYQVAKISIVDYNRTKNIITFKVNFYDYAKHQFTDKEQVITMKGRQIYFLTYLINFDYSQIETGQRINLAYPVKVFSEEITQDSAISLNINDTIGIPYIYHRNSKDLYGIDSATYMQRIQELFELINNPKNARLYGIRSFLEASPHNIQYPRKGQSFIIWVEQTGGLTIKKEEQW